MPQYKDITGYLEPLGYSPLHLDEIEDFHQKSKNTLVSDYRNLGRIVEYLSSDRARQESVKNNKVHFSDETVQLPAPEVPKMTFNDVLSMRRSSREFGAASLSLQDISNVLSVGQAKPHHQEIEEGLTPYFYQYPTPGGLHSAEIYIGILDSGLTLAHYNPIDHSMSVINRTSTREEFWDALCTRGQEGIKQASAVLIITSIVERLAVKYGLFSYRLALMEAGLLGYHFTLGATAHRVKSLTWAGYLDDDLNKLIDCDGVTETVTNCVLLGSD